MQSPAMPSPPMQFPAMPSPPMQSPDMQLPLDPLRRQPSGSAGISAVCSCLGRVRRCVSLRCVWRCVSLLLQMYTPVGVLTLLLWLILRPHEIKPRVAAAELSEFIFSAATSTVHYNLSVDLSFRNTHRRLAISYDDIGATVYYGGAKLGASANELGLFVQRPRTTTVVRALFRGDVSRTVIYSPVNETFARERAEGFFNLDMTVAVIVTYKVVLPKEEYDLEYDCRLRFPAAALNNGSSAMSQGSCTPKKY